MNDTTASTGEATKELDGLLALAEGVTNNIDALSKTLDRFRNQIVIQFFTVYVFLFAAFFVFMPEGRSIFFPYIGDSNIYRTLFLIGMIFGLFFLLSFLYFILIKSRTISSIKRELDVEYDVHERLLSLIDQQMRMVRMSMVSRALVEMRVRRLDRRRPRRSLISAFLPKL